MSSESSTDSFVWSVWKASSMQRFSFFPNALRSVPVVVDWMNKINNNRTMFEIFNGDKIYISFQSVSHYKMVLKKIVIKSSRYFFDLTGITPNVLLWLFVAMLLYLCFVLLFYPRLMSLLLSGKCSILIIWVLLL